MSKEYRKHKRVKPNVGIKILDVIRGEALGDVLNISVGGALIMTSLNLAKGEMYQTNWSFDGRGLKPILVGMECLWAETQQSGHCIAGLHIIDISDQDLEILERIIAQSKEI